MSALPDAPPSVSPLGNRVHPLGRISTNQPIQPVRENTRYVDAGAIRFGIESRELNEQVVRKNFGHDAAALAKVIAQNENLLPEDEGTSLHVFDSESGQEILRFDMFDDGPHYHYFPHSGGYHIVITYDVAANGDMFAWSTNAIRDRLDELFANAGWADLAARVDQSEVESALRRVEDTLESLSSPIAGRLA